MLKRPKKEFYIEYVTEKDGMFYVRGFEKGYDTYEKAYRKASMDYRVEIALKRKKQELKEKKALKKFVDAIEKKSKLPKK